MEELLKYLENINNENIKDFLITAYIVLKEKNNEVIVRSSKKIFGVSLPNKKYIWYYLFEAKRFRFNNTYYELNDENIYNELLNDISNFDFESYLEEKEISNVVKKERKSKNQKIKYDDSLINKMKSIISSKELTNISNDELKNVYVDVFNDINRSIDNEILEDNRQFFPILKRYITGETLESISNDYDITKERIRQIVDKKYFYIFIDFTNVFTKFINLENSLIDFLLYVKIINQHLFKVLTTYVLNNMLDMNVDNIITAMHNDIKEQEKILKEKQKQQQKIEQAKKKLAKEARDKTKEFPTYDGRLYDLMCEYRKENLINSSLCYYFTNEALKRLAYYKPLTKEEYCGLYGCSEKLYDAFGVYLVDIIREYEESRLKVQEEIKVEKPQDLKEQNFFDEELYEQLKLIRKQNSPKNERLRVIVYIHNEVLRRIAFYKPKSKYEFCSIKGVTITHYNTYGEQMIELIKNMDK